MRSRVPPLLLGATLLLWGWRNELLIAAVPMAVLIEAAVLVPWRWNFTDTEFNRLADVSVAGFVLLAAWQFDEQGISAIYGLLQWLPVALMLLLTGQIYSTRDEVALTALFLSMRLAAARGRIRHVSTVDLRAPFFAITLVAASANGHRDPALFAGAAVLLGWWLLANRPRGYALPLWGLAFAVAIGGGWVGQRGIIATRHAIEPLVMSWIRERVWDMRSPFRSHTAIGEIGEFKTSNRIVLWIHVPRGEPVPSLLREAAYRTYSKGVWIAGARGMVPVPPSTEDGVWHVGPEAGGGTDRVWIARHMRRGRGLLAVPTGTGVVDHLPVVGVSANALGALEVTEGPALVNYRARYEPGTSRETAPDGTLDLSVPVREHAVVGGIAARLGLASLEPQAAIARVRKFFADDFAYSLGVRRPHFAAPTIEDFLTQSHSGHCEYFATATVLLLRAAGIPARYQTGYSVQEYSRLEGAWIARRRHSHAWAVAWVDGRWMDVDTTPAVWVSEEAQGSPWWQPASDLISWLVYRFRLWRLTPGEGGHTWYFWAAGALVVLLAWRLHRSDRVTRDRRKRPSTAERADDERARSAFAPIERRLAARGIVRPDGEALGRWLARIDADGALPGAQVLRARLLPAHYVDRFRPGGLDGDELARLHAGVEEWMREYGETVPTSRAG